MSGSILNAPGEATLAGMNDQPVYFSASPTPPDAFTTVDVCRLTGLTFRQLDYWARTRVLRPSVADARGSGTKRLYSADDVRRALILARLLDSGVSLQRARLAASLLNQGDGCRWLVVGGEAALCADGELERIVAELGVCTIVDLEEEAFDLSA